MFPGSRGFATDWINIYPLDFETGELDPGSGKFIIKPMISASAGYESNYFRTDDNPRSTFVYHIEPGIQVGYKTEKTTATLNYATNFTFYNEEGGTPQGQRPIGDDDYTGHTFNFSGSTKPTAKLTVSLADDFYKTREHDVADPYTNEVGRQKYYINTLVPTVDYQVTDRFSATLSYRNVITEYANESIYTFEEVEDSIEHGGTVGIFYHLSPTASLGAEYSLANRNYDSDINDYTSQAIRVVFSKQGNYLSYGASIGYHDRQFDDDSEKDSDTLTYSADITYRPVSASQTYARLGLNQDFGYSGTGNFKRYTQVSLNVGRTFLNKLFVDLEGFYRLSDYQVDRGPTDDGTIEDREEDTYGIALGLRYPFLEWLAFRLKVGYDENDSNIVGGDFENTFVMLSLDAFYDFSSK